MKPTFMLYPVCFGLILAFVICPSVDADPTVDDSKSASFLARHENRGFSLRIMSWNVWKNSIFPPEGKRHEAFKRIVKAVRPDLILSPGGRRHESRDSTPWND